MAQSLSLHISLSFSLTWWPMCVCVCTASMCVYYYACTVPCNTNILYSNKLRMLAHGPRKGFPPSLSVAAMLYNSSSCLFGIIIHHCCHFSNSHPLLLPWSMVRDHFHSVMYVHLFPFFRNLQVFRPLLHVFFFPYFCSHKHSWLLFLLVMLSFLFTVM